MGSATNGWSNSWLPELILTANMLKTWLGGSATGGPTISTWRYFRRSSTGDQAMSTNRAKG